MHINTFNTHRQRLQRQHLEKNTDTNFLHLSYMSTLAQGLNKAEEVPNNTQPTVNIKEIIKRKPTPFIQYINLTWNAALQVLKWVQLAVG